MPNNRATTVDEAIKEDIIGKPDLQRDQHVSEPASYIELHARPSEEQSPPPDEYQALEDRTETPGYYNAVFEKGSCKNEDDDVYAEIASGQC